MVRWVSPLLALGCGAPTDKSPSPTDVAEVADPSTCAELSFASILRLDRDAFPHRGDPSGTHPGAALGDLDGDGDLDALVAFGGGAFVLDGDGAGGLTLRDSWTVDGQPLPAAVSVALADLDGDGDLDAWLGRAKGETDLLLEQTGPETFRGTPLAGSESTPGTGAFGDLDGDGRLDLFVSGFVDHIDVFAVTEGTQVGAGTALWLQQSDGTFRDATDQLPAETVPAITFQGALLDADDDGDLDIYLANDRGGAAPASQLLLSDGAGGFRLSDDCGCDLAMAAMGAGVGDANADGWPDVLVSDFGPPELFLGQGDGTFVLGAVAMGADVPLTPDHATGWGTALADLDQDGCMDMVVTYGECCRSSDEFVDSPVQYDQVLRSDCSGGFTRVDPHWPGLDNPDRSRSVAIGDFDGDLRPDLLVVGKHFVEVFAARGGCGAGLAVSLDAGPHNAHGLGARVEVEVAGRTTTQWMLPATASSSSELRLYFGLGTAPHADRLTVTWPDGASTLHDRGLDEGSVLELTQPN